MRVRRFAAILALSLCIPLSASAALLYDSFSYEPVGSQLRDKVNPGGATWNYVGTGTGASADLTIGSGSLTYTGFPESLGNSVLTNRSQSGVDRITLPIPQNTGTVYYSMLVRVNDMTGLTNTTTGSFFAGLNNTAGPGTSVTSAGAGLFIHRDADNASAYNLGVGVSTLNPDRIFDTTEFLAGDTVLVVASYEFVAGADNDIARLWINPAADSFSAETAPPPTVGSFGATDPAGSDTAGSLVSFFLRNNSVEPQQIQVDEVRVDNTWAGVTVPEPASTFLLLLSLPLFSRRRFH